MILFVFDSRCLSSSPISIWIIWQVLFKLPVRICFIGMWREGHSMVFLFSLYLEGKQTNYDLYIYVEEWNKWVNMKLERPTSSSGLTATADDDDDDDLEDYHSISRWSLFIIIRLKMGEFLNSFVFYLYSKVWCY